MITKEKFINWLNEPNSQPLSLKQFGSCYTSEVRIVLSAQKNHPINFDDTAARQLIECIKVV